MKKEIHPEYGSTRFVCVCGNVIETRSTVGREKYNLEICSNCHPFYTGKQKLVDTAGRIERYRRKYKLADPDAEEKAGQETKEAEASS